MPRGCAALWGGGGAGAGWEGQGAAIEHAAAAKGKGCWLALQSLGQTQQWQLEKPFIARRRYGQVQARAARESRATHPRAPVRGRLLLSHV